MGDHRRLIQHYVLLRKVSYTMQSCHQICSCSTSTAEYNRFWRMNLPTLWCLSAPNMMLSWPLHAIGADAGKAVLKTDSFFLKRGLWNHIQINQYSFAYLRISYPMFIIFHLLFNPIPTEPEPAPQTRDAHFQQRHSHQLSCQLIASPSEISKRSPKESLQLEWNKTTATGAVPGSVWAISSPDQIALPRNGRVLAAFPVPRSLWSLLQHCRRNCHIGSS
jgi:hypothetical protein